MANRESSARDHIKENKRLKDCTVRVGFAVVRVEPSSPAAFWDIARRAMADLAGNKR